MIAVRSDKIISLLPQTMDGLLYAHKVLSVPHTQPQAMKNLPVPNQKKLHSDHNIARIDIKIQECEVSSGDAYKVTWRAQVNCGYITDKKVPVVAD